MMCRSFDSPTTHADVTTIGSSIVSLQQPVIEVVVPSSMGTVVWVVCPVSALSSPDNALKNSVGSETHLDNFLIFFGLVHPDNQKRFSLEYDYLQIYLYYTNNKTL